MLESLRAEGRLGNWPFHFDSRIVATQKRWNPKSNSESNLWKEPKLETQSTYRIRAQGHVRV